jgi:hypothetical protein
MAMKKRPAVVLGGLLIALTLTQRYQTNAKGEAMRWLQGEPTLDDVLSDPTVLALMKRDEVDPDDLLMFLEDVSSALEARLRRRPRQSRAQAHARSSSKRARRATGETLLPPICADPTKIGGVGIFRCHSQQRPPLNAIK